MTYLPFLPEFVPKILSGLKTMTSRTKRYGEAGEVLDSPAGKLRLRAVTRVRLDVVLEFYRQEGCQSPQEFIDIWKRIHPRRGFLPNELVWLHEFEVVT